MTQNVSSGGFELQLLPLNGRIACFHVFSRVNDWENELQLIRWLHTIVYDEASSSRR